MNHLRTLAKSSMQTVKHARPDEELAEEVIRSTNRHKAGTKKALGIEGSINNRASIFG